MTKSAFLAANPICCFCGGYAPSTTIDHQPAKIAFPNKHRPKGLEFPACYNCNQQTRGSEALLALICRFTGGWRTYAKRDYGRLRDIVSSVNQSFPGLLVRMRGTRLWTQQRGVWVRAGTLDVNQPEIHLGLCRIAAKLSLAVYYELNKKPASKEIRINTQWAHSQKIDIAKHVNRMLANIPKQKTLRMGTWHTDDSFYLRYHFEAGELFCVGVFHESVALMSQLREPQVASPWLKWDFVMAPTPDHGITVVA